MNIKQLAPRKNSRYKQGYINPQSCTKLFESVKNSPIIFRSSYEKKFIYWCERSNKVKKWGSECVKIPYMYIDNKQHTYYPDYVVEKTDGITYVVEIKPYNQTHKQKNETSWAHQQYVKNMYKWSAAKKYCDDRNLKFIILTERSIEKLLLSK